LIDICVLRAPWFTERVIRDGLTGILPGGRDADRTNGLGLFEHEDHAFTQIELIMHAIVTNIAGHEILANEHFPNAGIDEHATFDRGFVDPVLA
jgi:hypothetical protein